jgi:hypothetical protein
MEERRSGAIRTRLAPLGMSLAAAAATAVAFAAVSLAANDNGAEKKGDSGAKAGRPAPPAVMMFGDRLSEEDRQKLEEFRRCMDDNGAAAPPDPGEIHRSDGPPDPPTAEEMEKVEKAYEACKDELPEDLRNGHPPHLGSAGCEDPGGVPQEEGQREQGSAEDGGSSSGSSA